MNVSLKTLRTFVRKIRLSPNCVLAIKEGSELAKTDTLEVLSDLIQQEYQGAVIVVVVDDFDSIETISEENMNSLGWFKIESLKRIARKGAERGKERD